MRLAVPFVESREIDSMLCAALGSSAWLVQEFLYRDILRKALSLDRTLGFAAFTKAERRLIEPKALKIF